MLNRHLLLLALCLSLSAPQLPSQEEAADPALELYFAANAAYNRKLYPIAAGNYQSFLARYAAHPKAHLARYGLGLSQFALKQYDKAVGEFLKLINEPKLDSKIERGRLTLLHAQCLLYGGKKEEAQARLVAAASNLPPGVHQTGAIAAVADLFFGQNDWQKTVTWSRKVQSVKSTSAQRLRAGYQEGYALFKLAKFPEAIAGLEKTRTLATTAKSETWVTRINYLLSECHASNKSLDKAEAALQSALANLRGSSAVDAQYRLGTIKFNQEKWIEAQADFENFLRDNKKPETDDPRIREARFHVARCLMEQKETNKADKKFGELSNGNDEVAGRAVFWKGRLYSRDGKYAQAANALRTATDKEWYKKGFPASGGKPAPTIVADIDFEYANALMLQKAPSWMLALQFLQRVQAKRRDYGQMSEVFSQQAICQHKLKQFEPSRQTTERFIAAYAQHKLIADIRFLHAENLFLLKSDSLEHWDEGEKILTPVFPWELVQIGNCGPPIELDEGWLLLTHGVGAMRKYSIGAALLDKDDPSRVLGRMKLPLVHPSPKERDGYVPNVVYSCGGLVHDRMLLLPYGVADSFTTFAQVALDDLLAVLE